MKMPPKMDKNMFAPCGVDCSVCSGYLRNKNPCSGCLTNDSNKPNHCLNCMKKQCAMDQGFVYCFECKKFPCAKIKYLDKRYRENYNTSLVENSNIVKADGLENFYEQQKELFTCKHCDGVIDVHHRKCSECGKSP